MFFKAIGGILRGNFGHISVAGNFGNDGGGGDFFDKGISFFEQGDLGFEWGVLEETVSRYPRYKGCVILSKSGLLNDLSRVHYEVQRDLTDERAKIVRAIINNLRLSLARLTA